MTQDRERSRPKAEAPKGWGKTDLSTMKEKAKVEETKQKERRERGNIFRYFIKRGTEADLVILDDQLDFAINEHTIYDPRDKSREHVSCPKDWEVCPICQLAHKDKNSVYKDSVYTAFLTVLDLTPWTDKQGVEHEYSVRLLPLKGEVRTRFFKYAERYETLRGLRITMIRDEGEKSAATGTPFEVVKQYDEAKMVKLFGHPAVKSRDGKELVAENGRLQPVDYGKMFPIPDGEDLRKRYGGDPVPGSAAERRAAFDDDGEDDGEGVKKTIAPKRRRYEEDEDEDEVVLQKKAATKSTGGRSKAKVTDEEFDGDDDEDAPKTRTRTKPNRAKAEEEEKPKSRTRAPAKKKVDDDEPPFDVDDDDDED